MSECETPQFWNMTEPVARKQHKCCECFAEVNVGKYFKSLTGKSDREE